MQIRKVIGTSQHPSTRIPASDTLMGKHELRFPRPSLLSYEKIQLPFMLKISRSQFSAAALAVEQVHPARPLNCAAGVLVHHKTREGHPPLNNAIFNDRLL